MLTDMYSCLSPYLGYKTLEKHCLLALSLSLLPTIVPVCV